MTALLKLLICAARSALTGAGEGFLDCNEGELTLSCPGEAGRLTNGEARGGIFFRGTGVGVDGVMVMGEGKNGVGRFGRGARIE